jgi:TatD DNase family protein
MIFDTHAHYNDKQFDADRDELLSSMSEQNVGTIVNVGASFQDCKDGVALARKYPFVYAAVGLHPDDVGELEAAEPGDAGVAVDVCVGGKATGRTGESGNAVFDWIRGTAKTEPKVVAIGEIGLNYHWNVETHDIQEKWFKRQLDLAEELNLPVSIHSRDAAEDTLRIMKEYAGRITAVMHCYSYSPELAEEYVKLGYYFGVGGVVTFKNGKKLKRTVEAVPMERILLETDCPYLAPDPYRGKRNHSGYIDYVAAEIARLKGMTKEEVIAVTEENAKRFFRLG